MSFAHAPVTKGLMLGLGSASLLISIFGLKHYFHLTMVPHISRDHQYWRLFTHNLIFVNSSEVFVAELLLFHISIQVERCFGVLKFASFVFTSTLFATLLTFSSLLVFNHFGLNHIPAGPTALLISIVYQYHRITPTSYTFRIGKITFSNKIFYYVLASQLALAKPSSTLLTCLIGIITGQLYRSDLIGLKAYRFSHPTQPLALKFLLPLLVPSPVARRTNRALPDLLSARPPRIRGPRGARIQEDDQPITTAPRRRSASEPAPAPPSAMSSSSLAGTLSRGAEVALTPLAPVFPRIGALSPMSPIRENPGGNDTVRPGGMNRQASVIGQWVDELTGRGTASGVRVPTRDEIDSLSTMFPDARRQDVLSALQRSENVERAVELMLSNALNQYDGNTTSTT